MTGPVVVTAVWKEPPSNPVIREQVLLRAAAWRELGFDARVALGIDASARDLEVLEATGVPWSVFKPAGMPSLMRFVGQVMREQGGGILVCRGALVAAAALLARKRIAQRWLILHDARGWYTAESETKREGRARRRAKRAVETAAFRGADHSVVVSQPLLGVGLAYGADPARVTIIPQYVEPFRPAEEPLPAEPDVVYVGNSMHAYQSVELILPLLEGLAERMPDVTFGWLDSGLASGSEEKVSPNLWRRSVDPDTLGPYLARARAALLIREASGTNAAAAPTKAFQYLTAGIAVVTTPHPPAVAELCRQEGRGRVVYSLDPGDWAEAVGAVLSTNSRESFDAHGQSIDAWAALLRALAGRR
ncbi:MAG TPA: glycosyltransferase [Thermoleophilaceae bacterium]|nr:glycosyltransferase [Thermoleophilaceae bacterium]